MEIVEDREAPSILDDPFADQVEVERAMIELESAPHTLFDLMYEIWNNEYTAVRNLRLVIGALSKYMTNQRKINPDTRRMHEGCDMKIALMEVYGQWLQRGSMAPGCTRAEMYSFVRHQTSKKLYGLFARGLMSEETFNEWVNDCKAYVESLPTGEKSAVSILTDNETDEHREGNEVGYGLDSLFESTPDWNCLPQFVSKVEDGRLFTLRSPGEIGSQLIRVNVYDVKSIAGKDRRHWWRYARLRTQFVLTNSDHKRQLLHRFLDEAANDLKKISGITRNVTIVSPSD